jgi:hypothetical protein
MKCIHLDFHTSPHIEKIGESFNKAEFTKMVKDAKIDLMTVFGKCHHGYTYYPSKVGQTHPNLNFNLLKEEIEAIHEAGAKAPIYIPIGWSKLDADRHPEWRQVDFYTGKYKCTGSYKEESDEEGPLGECAWVVLCPSGEYLDYLDNLTREICENFDVSDGIFYDICFFGETCVCENCKAGMRKMGLNPENAEDVKKYYSLQHIEMMRRLTATVKSYAPDAPVFYNGGADMNRTEYHPYQTHFELEDLPTAWGGYDLMPIRAKFFEKYGKHLVGMTGKFHHSWGEFGGFKDRDALRYECADMLSVGASISVGDHLHPSGKLDKRTYGIIGHAFDYVSKIDKFCYDTKAASDLAIWMSHSYASDVGASKLLQTMHQEYDVIENGESLSKYRCVILPDRVKLSEADREALVKYVNEGGRIVASYESIFEDVGFLKIGPSQYDLDFIECDVDEFDTPFLSYSSAYRVKTDGEVLGRVYEPYFSRTVKHFCGHKNTPYKTDAAEYPALVKKGGVVYFAHPVFEAYNNSGNYLLEKYIIRGISEVYDAAIKTENLPSCARVRLRENEKEGFLGLHVLYAPPVNRGNVCILPDFPTLYGVKITLRSEREFKNVRLEPTGEKIEFKREGNAISFTLPPFSLHQLVVLD